MKTNLILISLLIFTVTLHADIIIEYEVIPPAYHNELIDYRDLLPAKRLVAIKGHWVREQSLDHKGVPYGSYVLIDLKKKVKYWVYNIQGGSSISRQYLDNQEYTIAPSAAGKDILGHSCSQMNIYSSKDTTTAYSTTVFGIDYCPATPAATTSGLALEYSVPFETGPVTYKAIRFDLGEIDQKLFDIDISKAVKRITRGDKYVKIAKKRKEKRRNKQLNKAIKPLRGRSIDGFQFSPDNLRGKTLVLNFWFVQCGPCRKEMPSLNKIVARYADSEDVVFLAFALDDKTTLQEFLKHQDFDFHIVAQGRKVAKRFDVVSYPTTVIINPEGRIAEYIQGYTIKNVISIYEKIEDILQNSNM